MSHPICRRACVAAAVLGLVAPAAFAAAPGEGGHSAAVARAAERPRAKPKKAQVAPRRNAAGRTATPGTVARDIAPLPAPQLSADAREVLGWVRSSGDNGGVPFMILDKRAARLWVFDARAEVVGTTPVLLGAARGDHTVPGIGERPLSQVRPHEKTTPAGRYPIEPGMNLRGEYVLWLDYDGGLSMHRVLTTNARERRLHRLQTPTIADNRVSFGCINVPAGFFGRVLESTFLPLPRDRAVMYVLPEVRPLRAVFPRLAGTTRTTPAS